MRTPDFEQEISKIVGIKFSHSVPEGLSEKRERGMNFLDLSMKVSPKSGCESIQGQREYMEDRVVCFDDIKQQLPQLNYPNDMRISYFGVFDGHAGARTAEICKNQLHTKIICESIFQSVPQSIQNGINDLDEFIVETGLKEGWSEGSCLSVVIIINNVLYSANLGDSHIVLGRNLCKIEAIQLTETHKASEKLEKERIIKAGGMVMRNRVFGDLAISRAMGDLNYKKPKQSENFVSNVAYIRHVTLTPSNHFVILASDGLWDKFSNLEAVEFIYEKLKENSNYTANDLSKFLTDCAFERGSGDNISVIVVLFDWTK